MAATYSPTNAVPSAMLSLCPVPSLSAALAPLRSRARAP